MQKLAKEILKLLIGLIIIAYLLDYGLTWVYRNIDQRTKINYIKGKSFDILILGSSRAEHNIVAKLISNETGLTVFNFAAPGNWGMEIYTYLSFFLKHKGKTRMALIQVDDKWDLDTANTLATPPLAPYMGDAYLNEYFKNHPLKNKLKLPLYRYIRFPDKSWRELIKLTFRNREKSIPDLGYKPKWEPHDTVKREIIWKINEKKSKYFAQIIELCKANNIVPVFFTSPMHSLKKSNHGKVFGKYFTYYFDQADLFNDKPYLFRDETHVIDKGAKIQTLDLLHKIQPIIEKTFTEKN